MEPQGLLDGRAKARREPVEIVGTAPETGLAAQASEVRPSQRVLQRGRRLLRFGRVQDQAVLAARDQVVRLLDTSRARGGFCFEARTTLEEGLARTVDWYRTHRAGATQGAVIEGVA